MMCVCWRQSIVTAKDFGVYVHLVGWQWKVFLEVSQDQSIPLHMDASIITRLESHKLKPKAKDRPSPE